MTFETWASHPLTITGIVSWLSLKVLFWCFMFKPCVKDNGPIKKFLESDLFTLVGFIGPDCIFFATEKLLTSVELVLVVLACVTVDVTLDTWRDVSWFKKGLPARRYNNADVWVEKLCARGVLETGDCKKYSFEPNDVYEDFGGPLSRCVLWFFGQAMLVWMILYNVAYEPVQEDNPSDPFATILGVNRECFFFWSSIVVQFAAVSQSGASFRDRLEWWLCMLYSEIESSDGVFTHRRDSVEENLQVMSRFNATLRFLGSFIVNGLFLNFLLMVIPVLLRRADTPLDFVNDTLAVTFIVTLDDLSNRNRPIYYLRDPLQFVCRWPSDDLPAPPAGSAEVSGARPRVASSGNRVAKLEQALRGMEARMQAIEDRLVFF